MSNPPRANILAAQFYDGWRHSVTHYVVNDEEHGGYLIPTMMLYHKHDEDPEMHSEPISAEHREEIIVHMAAGLVGSVSVFQGAREANAGIGTPEPQRSTPKVGRNDPCPCGSGKKYKKCCGGAAVN